MIRWTDEAKADVEGVIRWLSDRNPQAGERVTEDVLAAIENLAFFPLLGRLGRVEGTRELVVGKWRYLVVYQSQRSQIIILRGLHGARLWPPGGEA